MSIICTYKYHVGGRAPSSPAEEESTQGGADEAQEACGDRKVRILSLAASPDRTLVHIMHIINIYIYIYTHICIYTYYTDIHIIFHVETLRAPDLTMCNTLRNTV